MSDNHDNHEVDTLDRETEDRIRARMRALAQDAAERADADRAFARVSRRSGPSASRLLAIAASVLAVVALAVALVPDPETVHTTDQPAATDCPDTEGAVAPTRTPGGAMNPRFPTLAATAAAAILIGACGDDGPTLLARGEDVQLVGVGDGLAGQTLSIDARMEDGEATGEFRVTDVVNTIRCADTSTDGVVILGGEVTAGAVNGIAPLGALHFLIIREGDPDLVTLGGNDVGADSCRELLESIPDDAIEDLESFVPVEAGSDIETG